MHTVIPWNICTDTLFSPACGYDKVSMDIADIAEATNSTNVTEESVESTTELANFTRRQGFYSEKFFHDLLNLADDTETIGHPQWQLSLCVLLVCCFITVCLFRNIRSFGKISYVTSFLVIVFLSAFLMKVISHGGKSYVEGVQYFFFIDWSKMKSSQVWADAVYEVIFSLGPCFGGLVALASKNNFHHNCYRDAVFVVIVNSVLSVFGGFVVYALLGHFCEYIDKVPKESISIGIGLAFIVYPMALSELPVAQLWSALFFLALFLIGLESNVGLAETIVQAVCEMSPHSLLRRRNFSCLLVGLCIAGGGIFLTARNGLHLIILLDTYSLGVAVVLIGLLECVVVAYIYGMDRLSLDMKAMFRESPSPYWKIMWKFLTPLSLIGLFLFICLDYHLVKMGKKVLPHWTEFVRWSVIGLIVLVIITYMVYCVLKRIIYHQPVKGVCYPDREWGPSLPEKQKKLHSALYSPALQPVLMVRVAIDPDEISPTGMMIGAKPDFVIPHGFFLNPNKKEKIKNKNRPWSVVSHSHLPHPEELSTSYWSSGMNRFASRPSSHISSNKSVSRDSLSNFNQGTQTDDLESDCSGKNSSEEACCQYQPICEATNASLNVKPNQRHDKIINQSSKKTSKDDTTRLSKNRKSSEKQTELDGERRAIFFLESSEHDKQSDSEEDNAIDVIGKNKAAKCSCKCRDSEKSGHENFAYSSD